MSKYPERLHETVARNGANVNSPERIALEELVEATEAHLAGSHSDKAWHIARARVVLALNAARNALKAGTRGGLQDTVLEAGGASASNDVLGLSPDQMRLLLSQVAGELKTARAEVEQAEADKAKAVAAERERWKAPTLILWPLTHRITKDLVFTAERAGEVQAAIQQLRELLKA